MSIIKKILIITQLLVLTISGNGCANDESIISNSEISIQTAEYTDISTTESNVPATETVFEPVPVPEDGWTMEELAKTIRINGVPISYPFTIGSLGEEYRFVDAHHLLIAEPEDSGFIEYKGTLIACVGFEKNSQDIDDNYAKKVRVIAALEDEENPEYNNAFTINGIGYGASPEDVKKAFGVPNENTGTTYTYYENGKEEYFLHMYFDDNKKLRIMYFHFR